MEDVQQHLSRDDRASWRGWLGGKVANAEAALASVFNNEGAESSAPPPHTAKPPHLQLKSQSHSLSQSQQDEDQFFAPRMSRTASGLSFSDAWCAVRRAAVAAMGTFEHTDGDACKSDSSDAQAFGQQTGSEKDVAVVKLEERPVLGHRKRSDLNVPPETPLPNFSMSDCSEMEQLGKDVQFDTYDDDFPPVEHHNTSTLSHRQKCEMQSDKKAVDNPESIISEERLAQLRSRFELMFEQNGGAECVARVKEIGDVQLIRMRDSTTMDSRVLAELREAKHILDDALSSLECAARNRTDETGQAASAAASVIEQTKENANRQDDLVDDCNRLLAVFASKVCSNVLRCVEERDVYSWTDRVKRLVDIASVGVGQLRTICFSFAEELAPQQTCTPALKDVSVKQVLQCVALAVAAFHIEAAERAVQCSAQF